MRVLALASKTIKLDDGIDFIKLPRENYESELNFLGLFINFKIRICYIFK